MMSFHLRGMSLPELFVLLVIAVINVGFVKLIWWATGKKQAWEDVRRGYFFALACIIGVGALLSIAR